MSSITSTIRTRWSNRQKLPDLNSFPVAKIIRWQKLICYYERRVDSACFVLAIISAIFFFCLILVIKMFPTTFPYSLCLVTVLLCEFTGMLFYLRSLFRVNRVKLNHLMKEIYKAEHGVKIASLLVMLYAGFSRWGYAPLEQSALISLTNCLSKVSQEDVKLLGTRHIEILKTLVTPSISNILVPNPDKFTALSWSSILLKRDAQKVLSLYYSVENVQEFSVDEVNSSELKNSTSFMRNGLYSKIADFRVHTIISYILFAIVFFICCQYFANGVSIPVLNTLFSCSLIATLLYHYGHYKIMRKRSYYNKILTSNNQIVWLDNIFEMKPDKSATCSYWLWISGIIEILDGIHSENVPIVSHKTLNELNILCDEAIPILLKDVNEPSKRNLMRSLKGMSYLGNFDTLAILRFHRSRFVKSDTVEELDLYIETLRSRLHIDKKDLLQPSQLPESELVRSSVNPTAEDELLLPSTDPATDVEGNS